MSFNIKSLALSGGITYGMVISILTLMTTFIGIGSPAITFFLDLPMYSLSFMGSIVGFLYGFIIAYVILFIFGTIYTIFDA